MKNLERMQLLTANFHKLQGLRILPFHLVMLLVFASGYLPIIRFKGVQYAIAPRVTLLVSVLGLPAAGLLFIRIGKYYEGTFSQVHPTHAARRRLLVLLVLGIVVFVLGGFLSILNISGRVPINVLGLTMGIGMIIIYSGFLRIQYLAFGAILACLSLLPVFGAWFDALAQPEGTQSLKVMCWAMLSVGAVLDHLQLVNSLKSLSEDSDDADV